MSVLIEAGTEKKQSLQLYNPHKLHIFLLAEVQINSWSIHLTGQLQNVWSQAYAIKHFLTEPGLLCEKNRSTYSTLGDW